MLFMLRGCKGKITGVPEYCVCLKLLRLVYGSFFYGEHDSSSDNC